MLAIQVYQEERKGGQRRQRFTPYHQDVHDRIRQAREDKILQQEFEREMLIDQMIFISDFEQNKV
jgi:ribosome-binding protein aMBF1 (putative translation factor)